MIVVHAEMRIDDGERERADRPIDDLVDRSRAESGAIEHRVSRARDDAQAVRFLGPCEDRTAHETRTASGAYRAFVAALPAITAGEIETIQYETDDVTRVPFPGREAAEKWSDRNRGAAESAVRPGRAAAERVT